MTPKPEQTMENSGEGLIAEVSGLSKEGYGHASAAGKTPEGYEAKIDSPKFEGQREKNIRQASKPRQLRVYIEATTVKEEEERVISALLEFFGTGR